MLVRALLSLLALASLSACGDKEDSAFPETVIVERGPTTLQWTYEELGCDTPQDGMMEGAFATPPSAITVMYCSPSVNGVEVCGGPIDFNVLGGTDIHLNCSKISDGQYAIVSYW